MNRIHPLLCCAAAAALFQITMATNARAGPILLTAGNYAVLGAETVTNTGATTLGGDLGVYPGSAITGSETITLYGELHQGDAVAQQAQIDATAGYDALTAMLLAGGPLSDDLTGLTVGVGVYDLGAALLDGNLILDFANLTGQNIVFRTASTLTTMSGSSVSVINAGSDNHVYWRVGSSATIGTTTSFMGDIIALMSVAMQTGATNGCGSVIARTGEVTLDNNTIATTCLFGAGGTVIPTPVTNGATPVPEPGTLVLLGFGLTGLAAKAKARRSARGRQMNPPLTA